MTEETTFQDGSLDERRETLLLVTRESLARNDPGGLGLVLNSQHPVDLAALFRQLDEEQQQQALQVIAEPLAAEMLADLDTPTRLEIAEDLDSRELSELVGEMQPDDAADVLGDLPEKQTEEVLDLMGADEAEEVRELLLHPEDTGGGIMTSRLVAVRQDIAVADAIAYLHEWAREEEFFYLYVVDEERRLVGTLPLKRLLLAAQDTLVADLANLDPIAVREEMDQEEIAQIFADYDLLALPVVDEEGELVGQVTVDDIVDIIQEEATEDFYEMAAIRPGEAEERSIPRMVGRRLPWLLVCLAGTLLSGGVIHLFFAPLADVWPLLMIFVPAIMAMGGNTGIQTSTVTVRSLATGQLPPGEATVTVLRELGIALAMGILLAAVVFAAAFLWTDNPLVAGCVGLAMLAAVLFSAGLGAMIPLVFRRVGIDPAVASGPLITTCNDVVSLIIYFGIAIVLLNIWTR